MDWLKLAGGLVSSAIVGTGSGAPAPAAKIVVNKNTVALSDPNEIHDGWLTVDSAPESPDDDFEMPKPKSPARKSPSTPGGGADKFAGVVFLYSNDVISIEIDPVSGQFTLTSQEEHSSCPLSLVGVAAPIVDLIIPASHTSNTSQQDVAVSVDLSGLTTSVQFLQVEDEKMDETAVAWSKFAVENTNHIRLPENSHSKLQILYNMDHRLLAGMDILLQGKLEFEFPAIGHWVTWKFEVKYPSESVSRPDDDVKVEQEIKLDESNFVSLRNIVSCRSVLKHPASKNAPSVFVNGWNSWTFSGTVPKHSPSSLGSTRSAFLPFLNGPNNESYSLERSSPYYSQLFGDWFISVSDPDYPGKWFAILGFLSQRQNFGIITVPQFDKSGNSTVWYHCPCDYMHLREGRSFCTDPGTVQLETKADPLNKGVFASFFKEVALRNNARNKAKSPTGWCSWYEYQEKVTEEQFLGNLDALSSVSGQFPVEIVQLDDGFQVGVGDWTANPKFPHGMKSIADKVRGAGKIPGLWLAPFIAKANASSVESGAVSVIQSRQHPGYASKCGVIWSTEPVGLDPTAENTQKFVRDLLACAVDDWGYRYLKIDFLYAPAVEGFRADPCVTRAQSMDLALRMIRETVGDDVFVLGCGCPLGSAVGYVDAMRVSTDCAPNYWPEILGYSVPGFSGDPHFPCMKNAVRNSLVRAEMHQVLWVNDPDCLLTRETGSQLTLDEVIGMASVVSASAGSFFLSDDVTKLSHERRLIAESLLPVLDKPGRVLDVLHNEVPQSSCSALESYSGDLMLFSKFNWADQPVRYRFEDLKFLVPEFQINPEQILVFHCYEFWTNTYYKIQIYEHQVFFLGIVNLALNGDSNRSIDVSSQAQVDIPTHSARVFAIRKFKEQEVTYIGSNLHISGGNELSSFECSLDDRVLRFSVDVGRTSAQRSFWVYLGKDNVPSAKLVGSSGTYNLRDCGRGIVCITFDVKAGENIVELEW
eukprot:TRINITY_DN42449_c0_g1_i11.p1 TRINITY_DN42449_c0_g1~~TRINITY_DN42449_c0_g1_i11.p1  ORF type:complete len:984 (+),score=221.45 TRINITY_DN42449_c0_g1_i11:969-3920(+)